MKNKTVDLKNLFPIFVIAFILLIPTSIAVQPKIDLSNTDDGYTTIWVDIFNFRDFPIHFVNWKETPINATIYLSLNSFSTGDSKAYWEDEIVIPPDDPDDPPDGPFTIAYDFTHRSGRVSLWVKGDFVELSADGFCIKGFIILTRIISKSP